VEPLTRARALALAAAATSVALGGPVRAQSGIPLRIGTVPTESYAEPLFGLDGGFFAKAGLNVELTMFGTGGQITNAVAGGALDVGMADAIQTCLAVIRGIPFVFFAGGMQYVSDAPTTRLCINKSGVIRTAKDLEGQTIAINGLRSIQEISVREWLRQNGADAEKVRFVELPPSAVVAAIQRGTVAAAIVSEPALSAGSEDVRFFAKAYDALAKAFYINSWFANRDWLAKNADTARRLLGAVYETARWANTHHDESAPILAKYSKLEPERIRAMTRAVYSTTLDTPLMQPVIDLAFKYKVLERRINAADVIVKV
jgi:NitT/TauT family transport system substrate-binding protein